MRRVNIKNGDYLVVMYAVDNRQSLDQALNLCQEIREIKGNNTCDYFRLVKYESVKGCIILYHCF